MVKLYNKLILWLLVLWFFNKDGLLLKKYYVLIFWWYFKVIFSLYLFEIWWEIVGSADLSGWLCIIGVLHEFFNMLNPFVHSKMQFKQHKIVIMFCLFYFLFIPSYIVYNHENKITNIFLHDIDFVYKSSLQFSWFLSNFNFVSLLSNWF
jgi:hypothetical protein